MPVKLTKEEFIRRARLTHGQKYNYSKVIYIDSKTKVCIICPTHGEFEVLPDSHLRGSICWKCGVKKRSISNSTKHKEFIQKVIKLYGDKFDLSKTIYNHSRKKIIAICSQHGEFSQRADLFLLGHNCKKCSNQIRANKLRNNINDFINEANLKHNNFYDYSKFIYINNITKGIVTCPEHGDFLVSPNSHLSSKSGCPGCNFSKGELAIQSILKKHNIKTKPQYKIPDEKYLFKYDFYLPELNILIEFHGRQHYEWIPYFQKTYHDFEEQQRRDNNKIDLAKMKGIPLIEINYKQLKHMTSEQFEQMVLYKINRCTM